MTCAHLTQALIHRPSKQKSQSFLRILVSWRHRNRFGCPCGKMAWCHSHAELCHMGHNTWRHPTYNDSESVMCTIIWKLRICVFNRWVAACPYTRWSHPFTRGTCSVHELLLALLLIWKQFFLHDIQGIIYWKNNIGNMVDMEVYHSMVLFYYFCTSNWYVV